MFCQGLWATNPGDVSATSPPLRLVPTQGGRLTQPDKWWYLTELADRLGTSPSSLQRELSSLVVSGLLVQRREGTRVYFKAETRSPVFPELRRLFEKTAGLIPILEQVLKPFGDKIACAFVYGSVARSQEHALGDVDLMVVGKAGLADLSTANHSSLKK